MKPSKIGLLMIALAFAAIFFATCIKKVPLNMVGVKVNSFGEGTVEDDLEPGYYFILPGSQKLYLFDPTIQTFEMIAGREGDSGPLLLVGKDQYTTKFDITIVYRIKQDEAWAVSQAVGNTPGRIRSVLRSRAEKALWDALGRLDTQDFYNVEKREEARTIAKERLAVYLADEHLQLIDILFRAITYDPNLEKILVQKQLFDQRRALNVEKAKLEAELEKTQSIQSQTTALVRVITEEQVQEIANIVASTDAQVQQVGADAQLDAETLLAEADRYRREKASQGDLAKTTAKAKGEKAMNEAYAVEGGRTYITRLMVENLSFGEIEVNTNRMNPFDVDQFLSMLGLPPEKTKP
ncbi:MAG: SPFH domain-containing protein [Planctomycetota bacterium]